MSDQTSVDRSVGYDEFEFLPENAEEAGLELDGLPEVSRVWVEDTPSGNAVSALVWGPGDPELVLLHGGAQNAHTWDSFALALGRPLVAIDLPGHGHSAWRDDHDYWPQAMADDVAHAMARLAPSATTLVGMSMGGLTAVATLAGHPDLVDRLVLVDVTPGVDREKASPIIAFVGGPEEFESFDEILERTMAFNPTRSRASLVRGVRHNAYERPDGRWTWRYDRPTEARGTGDFETHAAGLWEAISTLEQPILLVQGGLSGVVDDEDVAELQRRRPDAEVVVVEEAGHSVQGDRPVVLAELIADFHR